MQGMPIVNMCVCVCLDVLCRDNFSPCSCQPGLAIIVRGIYIYRVIELWNTAGTMLPPSGRTDSCQPEKAESTQFKTLVLSCGQGMKVIGMFTLTRMNQNVLLQVQHLPSMTPHLSEFEEFTLKTKLGTWIKCSLLCWILHLQSEKLLYYQRSLDVHVIFQ